MSQPLLEFKNVTKIFRIGGGLGFISRRSIKAIDSVSFSIPSDKPTVTALVGESGSGKSTIARITLGLL
ncbi:MAG: ATP-binding cassette domain-containing protein, partial [Thermoproteota archaeon]